MEVWQRWVGEGQRIMEGWQRSNGGSECCVGEGQRSVGEGQRRNDKEDINVMRTDFLQTKDDNQKEFKSLNEMIRKLLKLIEDSKF